MNISSFLKFFGLKQKLKTRVFLLNDHKTGFKLTRKIAGIINQHLKPNIKVRSFYLFWNHYKKSDKYILVVRHPKEIIISGYLYHKKCSEKWLLKKGGYYYGKWEEYHFDAKEIAKNKRHLDKAKTFCQPIPYQEKLNSLPQNEGIIYEMNAVSKLTIEGMYNLDHYDKSNTLVVKFEDLIFNHDETIRGMCNFLEINKWYTRNIIKESCRHNLLNQKKKNQITSHATNVNVDKDRYKQYWNETLEAEFNRLFPSDVLSKLGYE